MLVFLMAVIMHETKIIYFLHGIIVATSHCGSSVLIFNTLQTYLSEYKHSDKFSLQAYLWMMMSDLNTL